MFDSIKKAMRYIRREYPETSTALTVGFTIGATIGTAMTFGAGAPLFVIPLAGAGTAGLANLINFSDLDRASDNSVRLNGCNLVGNKKDLSSLLMAQRLIDDETKKLKHLPELPEKLRRNLLAHIGDVQGALARVRVYKGGQQMKEFSFHRDFFGSHGSLEEQLIATVRFEPLLPTSQKPGQTEVIDGAPRKARSSPPPPPPARTPIPANNNAISGEFGQLAKKIDAVAQRVDELENPAPLTLDKAKLKPPR